MSRQITSLSAISDDWIIHDEYDAKVKVMQDCMMKHKKWFEVCLRTFHYNTTNGDVWIEEQRKHNAEAPLDGAKIKNIEKECKDYANQLKEKTRYEAKMSEEKN